MTKHIVIPLDKYKRLLQAVESKQSKPQNGHAAKLEDPSKDALLPKDRAPWTTNYAEPEEPWPADLAVKRPRQRFETTPQRHMPPPPAPPGVKRKWLKMKQMR